MSRRGAGRAPGPACRLTGTADSRRSDLESRLGFGVTGPGAGTARTVAGARLVDVELDRKQFRLHPGRTFHDSSFLAIGACGYPLPDRPALIFGRAGRWGHGVFPSQGRAWVVRQIGRTLTALRWSVVSVNRNKVIRMVGDRGARAGTIFAPFSARRSMAPERPLCSAYRSFLYFAGEWREATRVTGVIGFSSGPRPGMLAM